MTTPNLVEAQTKRAMIGLMLLEASAGTRLTIEASGADEVAAVDALARLVGNRFGESAERPS